MPASCVYFDRQRYSLGLPRIAVAGSAAHNDSIVAVISWAIFDCSDHNGAEARARLCPVSASDRYQLLVKRY